MKTAESGLTPPFLHEVEVSDREFALFRQLIAAQTGIALTEHKRHLLRARLGKRLKALGLPSFTAYYHYLTQQDPTGQEMVRCLNAITTNKTDFFREPHHFRYLEAQWAPARRLLAARTGDRTVRFWSAGCSSGEEPYTLAMVLCEALQAGAAWDVKILASDLDTDMLAQAEAGIFPIERAAAIPPPLLQRYFLRGVGAQAGFVKVRQELRQLIRFRRINFNDAAWPIRSRFDGIFCRNVLIYFNRDTQRRILERLLTFLKPDGMLFLGHSESIFGLVDGLQHLGNTIYRRAGVPHTNPS
jgi:chemotaxis protein methyltransferase CheR